jgi:hypothetical protein
MRYLGLLLLFGLPALLGWLPAAPACAQGQPAQRANQACFNQKEAEAEAEVRTGIQLREVLRRCAMVYPDGQKALEDWYVFDRENADRLRAAVNLRRAALDRIYKNSAARAQWETDAVVATTKSIQINESVCDASYDVMARLKKDRWAGFKYYANMHGHLLANEIPLCRR